MRVNLWSQNGNRPDTRLGEPAAETVNRRISRTSAAGWAALLRLKAARTVRPATLSVTMADEAFGIKMHLSVTVIDTFLSINLVGETWLDES